MAKKGRTPEEPKFSGRFSVGKATAERDPFLSHAFFESPDYASLVSKEEPSAVLVGRTGSGKSAMFLRMKETMPDRVMMISPQQLCLPHISNNDVIKRLQADDYRLEPFFRPLWERVFCAEILHHRYKGRTPEAKKQFMDRIRNLLSSDKARAKALQYLDELAEDFWCTTDERVERIVDSFREQVERQGKLNGSLGVKVPLGNATTEGGLGKNTSTEHVSEVTLEQRDAMQRVINQSELPRLREMLHIISSYVLDSEQNFSYLLIDDLDKEWVEDEIRIKLIRCLLEAMVEMATLVPNLKILVALRTNIFEQLGFGAQRYGMQEEKIRDLVIPLRWTREDLRVLIDHRVRYASQKQNLTPGLTLESILPNDNSRRQPAFDFIVERTLLRPRDAISYLNKAIERAEGKKKLSWDHIQLAEEAYSIERLGALRDEWLDPFSQIDLVFREFERCPQVMDWAAFSDVLQSVTCNVLWKEGFTGFDWLWRMAKPIAESAVDDDDIRKYFPMAEFLFNIGLIGIRGAGRGKSVKTLFSYMTNDRLSEDQLIDTAYIEIHPAFRKALRCTNKVVESNAAYV